MKQTHPSRVLLAVRYGIGSVMIVAGIVFLFASPIGFGTDAFALGVGGGLSVLMINFLYRLGVSGDQDREREEEARRYLQEHGHWPDEEPTQPRRASMSRLADALRVDETPHRPSNAH